MIHIKVIHTDKETLEVQTVERTFESEKESIDFLMDVDNFKMQTICDQLNKGQYKPTLILKNPTSSYGIEFKKEKHEFDRGYKATDKKELYDIFAQKNKTETEIFIQHF